MRCKTAPQIVLSFVVSAFFFYLLYCMLTKAYPPENKDALNELRGVLTSIWILQQQWWFGSSSSTRAKDETISAIAQAAPSAAQPVTIPDAKAVTLTGDVNIPQPEPKQ